VTSSPGTTPSIDGNQLAWVADGPTAGESAVIVHDMASETTFVVATGEAQPTFRAAITGGTPRSVHAIPGEHRAQRSDGARVAVEAGGGIWVNDMDFGTATQLTPNGRDGTDASPAIDGARGAWESDRNGDRDIYVAAVDGWTIGVPATVSPTVAPTTIASRFGARRYVAGGGPQRPSAGATVGSSVFGSARPRAVVGRNGDRDEPAGDAVRPLVAHRPVADRGPVVHGAPLSKLDEEPGDVRCDDPVVHDADERRHRLVGADPGHLVEGEANVHGNCPGRFSIGSEEA
jgi:hypothetical protein